MRVALTVAVLLAVVSMALVAVCQHSETRRLQYRIWQLERRRERLERTQNRLSLSIDATRTPRRLLSEQDVRQGRTPATSPAAAAPVAPAPTIDGPRWTFNRLPGGGR